MHHAHDFSEAQPSFPFEPCNLVPFPAAEITPVMIYAEYPYKVARPIALKAIQKAVAAHGAAFVMERTKRFAELRRDCIHEIPHVPHPSTWYNQERFMDEETTWLPSARMTPTPAKVREMAARESEKAPEGWELFARTSPIHCEYAGDFKHAPDFMKKDFTKWIQNR